jgi:TfoX/Sxy family transcriptional regulator of competence genes
MAFDEALAERVRLLLADSDELYERKMFGGIAFMVSGHMACGILGEELIVRLGPEAAAQALERPHVRPFDFTGRPSRTTVLVDPAALDGDGLAVWVEAAIRFVATLPPKRPRQRG